MNIYCLSKARTGEFFLKSQNKKEFLEIKVFAQSKQKHNNPG